MALFQSSSEEDDWVEKNSSDFAPSAKRVNSASDCSLPQVHVILGFHDVTKVTGGQL